MTNNAYVLCYEQDTKYYLRKISESQIKDEEELNRQIVYLTDEEKASYELLQELSKSWCKKLRALDDPRFRI
jgi:hypothetical protein